MSETHELKTWDTYWRALDEGRKTFELREDDRGFQTGDTLILQRVGDKHPHYRLGWDGRYVGFSIGQAKLRATVTYICHGGRWGLKDGWVCLGLGGVERVDAFDGGAA